VNVINERNNVNSHVVRQFRSVSKHAMDVVHSYEWNQDVKFCRGMKENFNSITVTKQSIKELSEELTQTKRSYDNLVIRIGKGESMHLAMS